MNCHVRHITGKYLFICLFIISGALLAGCSKVNISNLHTQAAPNLSATELASLQSFDLLPLDQEEPFSEQLALDAARDNLLARGYRLDSQSPDFLVAVWFDHNYQAESHLAPAYPMMPGWYCPGFGRYRHHWPGYGHYLRSGSYTVINNYMVMAIAFVKPGSLETIKQNQTAETRNAVPAGDIIWLGQAHTKSSRNAFTTLSCLAAGILEAFPDTNQGESKGIELTRCY